MFGTVLYGLGDSFVENSTMGRILGKTAIKEFFVPPFQPLYERSNGKGLLAGRHWGSKATLIDTRVYTPSEEFLDPLLVRELKYETLDWGLEELRREMQLYPRGGFGQEEEEE